MTLEETSRTSLEKISIGLEKKISISKLKLLYYQIRFFVLVSFSSFFFSFLDLLSTIRRFIDNFIIIKLYLNKQLLLHRNKFRSGIFEKKKENYRFFIETIIAATSFPCGHFFQEAVSLQEGQDSERGHHPRRQSSIPVATSRSVLHSRSRAGRVCVCTFGGFAPLFLSIRVLSSILVWYRAHGESERIPWPPRPRPTNTLSAWIRSSVPSEITARTWPSGADPRESVVLVVVAGDRR